MATTRQCLLNQFADLSVCTNQNNFHKNSILVSDLRTYLFAFTLGGQSASSVEHLPSSPPTLTKPRYLLQRRSRSMKHMFSQYFELILCSEHTVDRSAHLFQNKSRRHATHHFELIRLP